MMCVQNRLLLLSCTNSFAILLTFDQSTLYYLFITSAFMLRLTLTPPKLITKTKLMEFHSPDDIIMHVCATRYYRLSSDCTCGDDNILHLLYINTNEPVQSCYWLPAWGLKVKEEKEKPFQLLESNHSFFERSRIFQKAIAVTATRNMHSYRSHHIWNALIRNP